MRTFNNREKAAQLISFKNLQWDKISATDIDFVIEIHNKLFIFGERKHGNSELPFGQKLALERIVDLIGETKTAVLLVFTHDTPVGQDIDAGNCIVREFRFNKQWHKETQGRTVKEFCDKLIEKYELQRRN